MPDTESEFGVATRQRAMVVSKPRGPRFCRRRGGRVDGLTAGATGSTPLLTSVVHRRPDQAMIPTPALRKDTPTPLRIPDLGGAPFPPSLATRPCTGRTTTTIPDHRVKARRAPDSCDLAKPEGEGGPDRAGREPEPRPTSLMNVPEG